MDRVGLDRFGEELTDRAFGGLLRIGGAHHFTIASDGVFALEDLNDNRTGGHEGAEIVEERALAMDPVEAFGLIARHADALRSDNTKARILERLRNRAGQVAAGCIGVDNIKNARSGPG